MARFGFGFCLALVLSAGFMVFGQEPVTPDIFFATDQANGVADQPAPAAAQSPAQDERGVIETEQGEVSRAIPYRQIDKPEGSTDTESLRTIASEAEKKLGPDHPVVRQLKLRLANEVRARTPTSTQQQQLRSQLAVAIKEFGPNHPKTQALQRLVELAEKIRVERPNGIPASSPDAFVNETYQLLQQLTDEVISLRERVTRLEQQVQQRR